MGGGGSYYDRDVTSSSLTSSRGFSDTAEQRFEKTSANPAVFPKNRRISSSCKSPLVYAFDVTGSMGSLPKVIYDKMPMMAGQLAAQEYLDDPMMSLAAIGDVNGDRAPIQICDFSAIRKLDNWLERLFLEGSGGPWHFESYEFTAYFYARFYDMKNTEMPIFLFTGDESFRKKLYAAELAEHFGGQHEDVAAEKIFGELKKKFKGNVFLLHRRYGNGILDKKIVAQWESVLGKECVVKLDNDKAIADTTLGIFAVASGARTLEQYLDDMRNRPLDLGGEKFEPQSPERVGQVRKSLELFASTRKPKPARAADSKKKEKAKGDDKDKPAAKGKVGRI